MAICMGKWRGATFFWGVGVPGISPNDQQVVGRIPREETGTQRCVLTVAWGVGCLTFAGHSEGWTIWRLFIERRGSQMALFLQKAGVSLVVFKNLFSFDVDLKHCNPYFR